MKLENVWKLSLLIFCRETVVIVSIVNLSICTSGKAHPPKKRKENANELLPLLRSLMLSANPIRPHFLSLPFPFLIHTHTLSVYERMRRETIEEPLDANAKKMPVLINTRNARTYGRTSFYSNSTLCPCCCLLALSARLRLRLSANALTSVPVPASVPPYAPGLPTGLPLMALPPEKSPPCTGSLGGGGRFSSLSSGREEPRALLDIAGGGGTVAKGWAFEGRTREPLRR
jgi:hypothetical protein